MTITAEREQLPFTYRFPPGPEPMRDAWWYSVISRTGGTGPRKMLLAKTDRIRRGAQRVTWVVFGHQKNTDSPTSTQICAEFIQTDNADLFSWEIPDFANPRSALKDGMPIPRRFADKTVQRTDQLYSSVKHGPTLRLVVQASEVEVMLEAGYWAAQLRNRFK